MMTRLLDKVYEGEFLERIAFPLGGIGAGTVCLEGNGALTKFSVRNAPSLLSEPAVFAALAVEGRHVAKVLEGPVPKHKSCANFAPEAATRVQALWGLPRFHAVSFQAAFPFATVSLADRDIPIDVMLTGWSPFEPGNEDDASLPVAALEYRFTHRGASPIEAMFSFNAANFLAPILPERARGRIGPVAGGFVLEGTLPDKPWTAASFAISTEEPNVKVNHAWLRGSGTLQAVWADIVRAHALERPPVTEARSAPGASLFVPFSLQPGGTKTIVVRLAWYAAASNLNRPGGGKLDPRWYFDHASQRPASGEECYRPWYAARFEGVEQIMGYWQRDYSRLRESSRRFSRTLHDSTLPAEIIEAVAANLSILKSPTVLRQTDGRFWAWEGCLEESGSCEGSCTHVWNYAQALPHLFPRLERTLRETEFGPNQDERGHQDFRAAIPIRPTPHEFHAAADGQLGGVVKVYRDWRISGDTNWLRGLWPRIRASLDYCIRTWDPRRTGWLDEPHHNTYDIEFWGPNGMCTSLYLSALKAATLMGTALGEDVDDYEQLRDRSRRKMEFELFNGDFFIQRIQWEGLDARYPQDAQRGYAELHSPEELALAAKEGPENQYGSGCLADGVVGEWLAWACGLEPILDSRLIARHLQSVHQHNFKRDLAVIANPTSSSRATFALAGEGGLVLCSWPNGGMPSLPFFYATEVWTGIEYQVASHLISVGRLEEGLEIVSACRRRYDGRVRNPFDEVEAGHWYARALSSYTLLQAFSGARYDAVERVLYLRPASEGDFRCFLATATGYGHVGIANGVPFVEVAAGRIPYKKIDYRPGGRR